MRTDQPTQPSSPRGMRILVWTALASAITLCATGEYHMAVEVGYDYRLAVFYPVALDVYALAAFKVHRRLDTFAAIGLMIVCNSLSHLLTTGQIPESQALTIAASAVPPLILWRVHDLDAFLTKTMLSNFIDSLNRVGEPAPVEVATPAHVPPVLVAEPVAVPAAVALAEVAPVVPESPAALDDLGEAVAEPVVRFPYGVAPTGIHQETWDAVASAHQKHPKHSAPALKDACKLPVDIRTIQRVVKAVKDSDNVLIAV
ncbi:hypothetical protein [Glycomyces sp. NPDC048151]|uniref:hypothetical protein n=1 Tax=Glycomyces sp. NPDC048151 TaxID=3364002 RepID=UPI003711724D